MFNIQYSMMDTLPKVFKKYNFILKPKGKKYNNQQSILNNHLEANSTLSFIEY
jgi:hypothetical protein